MNLRLYMMCLWFVLGCLREESRRVPSAPSEVVSSTTTVVQPESNRPRFWRGLGRPSEERVRFFRSLADEAMRGHYVQEARLPADSEAELAVFRARDYALTHVSDSHGRSLWEWPRVQRVLRNLGRSLPLTPGTAFSGGLSPRMMFGQGEISYWPVVKTLSTDELASILVHEATHVVFSELMEERYGYREGEMGNITAHCTNLQRRWKLVDESNAYLNQGLFDLLVGRHGDPSPSGHDALLRAGVQGLVGTPAERRRFMDAMFRATESRVEGFDRRRQRYGLRPAVNHCGHMVAIRGSHSGEYIFPTDLVPRLVPFVETIPWQGQDR